MEIRDIHLRLFFSKLSHNMPQNTLSYYCSLCVDQPISAEQLIAGNQPKDQLQSYTFFLNR